MREELKHATLPPGHPLTLHVHRVVKRILHASNLGSIRGEEKPTLVSPIGLGTDEEGRVWNPDADVGAARDPGAPYGPNKEWDVIVVNDKRVVNAMANPGIVFLAPPFDCFISISRARRYLYGNPTNLPRRGGISGCPRTWYVSASYSCSQNHVSHLHARRNWTCWYVTRFIDQSLPPILQLHGTVPKEYLRQPYS